MDKVCVQGLGFVGAAMAAAGWKRGEQKQAVGRSRGGRNCAKTCTSAEPSRPFQIAATGSSRSASASSYKLRWRIESAFNRLKDFRRIATRLDERII